MTEGTGPSGLEMEQRRKELIQDLIDALLPLRGKVAAIREAELGGLQLFTGGLPPAVETVGATSYFWAQDLALKFGLSAPFVEN